MFQYNYSEDSEGGFCEILGDNHNVAYRFNVSVNDGFRDFHGNTIDNVKYENRWGGDLGISLERVSKDEESNNNSNWGSSISLQGATPGKKNSITKKKYDLELLSCSFDKEYVILGDTTSVTVEIVNKGYESPEAFTLLAMNTNELYGSVIA